MKNNPFSFAWHQLEDKMPEALRPLNAEVKKASRRLWQERLDALELVPRAEFVAQQERLAQAEARLQALEARLQAVLAERSPPTAGDK